MRARRHVVTTADRHALALRIRPASTPRAPVLLLVHGFAQNHRAFDAPGHSLAEFLAAHGITAVMGELRGRGGRRTQALMPHGLSHHVDLDAPALVHGALDVAAGAPVVMLGHSMGALIVAALSHRVAGPLAGRILLSAPYRFLPQLGPARGPVARALRMTRRVVPLHAPTGLAGPLLALWQPILDGVLPPALFSVWAPRSVEPRLLRWALTHTFNREGWHVLADLFELGSTKERAGAVPVSARVRDMTGPVLVGGGDMDGLAPIRGVERLFQDVGTQDKELVVFRNAGHLDVLLGKDAPTTSWEAIRRFVTRVTRPLH